MNAEIKQLALCVDNLDASYGAVRALRRVSLTVAHGELVAVLGPNGAGKSTLLRAIAGVGASTTGDMSFEGRNIRTWSAERRVREGIAMVPEGRRLFGSMSVADNVRLGGVTCKDQSRRAAIEAEIEKLFPVVMQQWSSTAGELSGGQQQQVAIARALMSDPRVLLLDEPSLGLSPAVAEDVFSAVDELRRRGTTVVLVEQNVTRSLELADRAYVLTSGRVAQSGRPDELGGHEQLAASYFGMEA
ncbi:ABC transporter ATP-binding protein [Micromonospora sp. NPDC048830]|uniref:ABC transporter ATP-binding protein n=1 Tax=Micromonospora sp. NPDC048830 TaxID=3364257 RepID=UPI00371AF963